GLFIRTLQNLQHVDIGYNRESLLLFNVNAAANGATGPQSLALYERMRTRVAALPGVRHASFSRITPLAQSNWTSSVSVPRYVQTWLKEGVQMNGLGADYLATLELPVLRGRDFTARDQETTAPKVALVNQAFAKKYFGQEDIVGQRFKTGGGKGDFDTEIVG